MNPKHPLHRRYICLPRCKFSFVQTRILLTFINLDVCILQCPVSLEKALSFEIRNSHFDEPSPTSVLDVLFEDINEKSPISSESAITAKQGKTL